MKDWEEFHGCERLSDEECIEFLKHLEESGRVKTEEGAFLHNQYIRVLMCMRGIKVKVLDPSNGSLWYYNPIRLKRKYDEMKKSGPTSSYMCFGYALQHINSCLEASKEPYIPININSTLKTLNMIENQVTSSASIANIMNIVTSNIMTLLLTPNKNTLSIIFRDVIFSNGLGVCGLTLQELLQNWLNGDLMEYKQNKNIYIYNAKINRLSFTYEWKGYCDGLLEGKSKTYGKNGINIISNFIRKANEI